MKKNRGNSKTDIEKIPKKDIGLWMVVSFILAILAALLSIFSGVVTIKAGQFFVGVLFFILAGFLFVPKKYVKITGVLKGTIFVIVYFTLILISGWNAPQPLQQYEYYSLGQSFNLTSDEAVFSITIYNTSTSANLKIDGKETTSSGAYLYVNGVLTNTEKIPAVFNLRSELRDSEDNLYNLLAINLGVGSFQPNLERNFSHIFEIPKDVSGLEFSIKDRNKVIKVVSLDR
jgi:hypothetical protein